MAMRHVIILATAGLLAGCGPFPMLEDAVSDDAWNAPYPDLVPVEVLRAATPDTIIQEDTAKNLDARAKRLKSRASGLKKDVISPAEEARLQNEVENTEG